MNRGRLVKLQMAAEDSTADSAYLPLGNGANFTEMRIAELREVLDTAYALDSALAMFVKHVLAATDDNARRAFVESLADGFCLECGSDKLPCYCTRDE